eukprot:jgi/Mesvir1/21498/Mv03945-RA.1
MSSTKTIDRLEVNKSIIFPDRTTLSSTNPFQLGQLAEFVTAWNDDLGVEWLECRVFDPNRKAHELFFAIWEDDTYEYQWDFTTSAASIVGTPVKTFENAVVSEGVLKVATGRPPTVYDGDTVKVAVLSPWDNLPTLLTVRMWGTDADELAPAHDLPNRDEIRMRAMRARNRLVQLTTDVNVELADTQKSVKDVQTMIDARNQKLVTVQCRGFDCFGRVLGVLYDLDGTCINKVMLDEELVKPRPASERRAGVVL